MGFLDCGFGYGWLDCTARVQSVTGVGVLISPSVPSVWGWGSLTFDSSPIKGEGDMVGLACCHPTVPPLWIADQVRNDGAGHHTSALWIDESPMNLYEILGFQPKGVATLSFSSR